MPPENTDEDRPSKFNRVMLNGMFWAIRSSFGNVNAIDVLGGIKLAGRIVMGDKAYDGSVEIREFIESNGGLYCIPPKDNAKQPWDCDFHQYKERRLVECFFNKLKQFRRVATRYDKLSRNFLSFVLLASSMIWSK